MLACVFATTPEPLYVAVIFSSIRAVGTPESDAAYAATADRMEHLALEQPGYLGIESARGNDGFGITVSYWADEASARAWGRVAEHVEAQRRGRQEWYASFVTRVATVTRQSS